MYLPQHQIYNFIRLECDLLRTAEYILRIDFPLVVATVRHKLGAFGISYKLCALES